MASNLRVDTILPSSGTTLGIGTASGTINFLGNSNLTTTGDVTVGGNLGVGGTLTYEDVTNIDSVGLITGRSGLRVPAGEISLGTGTPRQKLHINASDSGASNMVFTNTTTGTSAGDGFGVCITGGEDAQLNMQESANLKFSTADTERLRIGSAGQIGIAGANYGTSGQVLTSQGASSAVQWATPSSGLSHAQQWYLTANGSTSSGNTDHVLPTDAGTWQKMSDAIGVRAGTLGSDMTYSGSGVFTFPVTGIWKIEFQGWWGIGASDSDHYLRSRIQTTVNNSSWSTVQEQANSVKSDSTYTYQGFYVSTLFDVTDTSLCKCRFVLNPSGSNTYYKADGSPPKTGAQFMRLGDT